jgi:hypothetical protein
LNPIERASAIQKFIDAFGWTHQQVGEKLRFDRSTVSNTLRLLSLPDTLQWALGDGYLSQRQATALIPFFELTTDEQEALLIKADFAEFIDLCRNGKINSDTIRERISDAIADIHPAPLQFALPEPAEAVNLNPPNSQNKIEGGETLDQMKDETVWLQEDIEGNDILPVPVQLAVESEPVKVPAPVISANQPALQVAPDSQLTIPPSSSIPAAAPVVETPIAPTALKPWAESNYTVTLGFQAEDGSEFGRAVIISTKRDENPPIFNMMREKSLNLPWQIHKLIIDLHPEDMIVE